MILSAQSIRKARIIEPFYERTVVAGMSFGLGPNGYDVRIAQPILIGPGRTRLASIVEHITMPNDVMARVVDKSTWARRFLSVFNTTIDAGWRGILTLELINHGPELISIDRGAPIAKLIFERLDEPTEIAYNGAYQNQAPGPQGPVEQQCSFIEKLEKMQAHNIRQENDEYACSCGMRWDYADGMTHP